MSISEIWESLKSTLTTTFKVQVLKLVIAAEEALEGSTGEEKRAYVIKQLDALIELPSFLEFLDDWLLGKIVDKICDKLNLLCGHDWSADLAALTDEQAEEIVEDVEVTEEDTDEKLTALYKQYGIA